MTIMEFLGDSVDAIRMRELLDSAVIWIDTLDPDGNVTFWNRAAERISGFSRNEVLGHARIWEWLYPDAEYRSQIFSKAMEIQRRGERVENFETTIRRKDGQSRVISWNSNNLLDRSGNLLGSIALGADITDRTNMEEALRQAMHVAENAARTKSAFLANMSHEIRTPMNGVIGMLNLALDTPLDQEQREYLELAKSSADSLLAVINDILDFSKIEANRLDLDTAEFNLVEVIESVVPFIGVEAHRKQLELICEVDPDVPAWVVGDSLRLKQVLINLLKNAIKFTEKGDVLLRVSRVPGSPEDAAEVLFSVRDTGIGIDPQHLDMIFESFTQIDSSTTRQYGGTGLGLAISRNLVQMMSGAIWVESQPGNGSTFYFKIPFGPGSTDKQARALPATLELEQLPVLVVDDNAINRRILRKYLESWQMLVTEAQDGPDGIEKVIQKRQAGGSFRVMILDQMMPGMCGFDLAEKLCLDDTCRDCIVIMLTSLDDKGSRARCRQLGIDHYLVKPISPSLLYNTIVNVIDKQSGEEQARKSAPATGAIPQIRPGLQVLLAEDNPVNMKVARRLLERAGIEVEVVTNGVEILQALEQRHYDLILMDVQMPVMDGLQATRLIREKERETKQHVPIVALTAHSMKGDRERILAAGTDDYLPKPLNADLLYRTIARITGVYDKGPEHLTAAPQARRKSDALFDPADIEERMDADAEIIREVLQVFIDTSRDVYGQLIQSYEQGIPEAVRAHAHNLKGMAANVSAGKLRAASLALEELADRGNLTQASALPGRISQLLDETIVRIKTYLGSHP